MTEAKPIAWIVKWKQKSIPPEHASAYLSEDDAQRAASNIKSYADVSDVTVIPAFGPDEIAKFRHALEVLLREAESFNVSGVYFDEECMGHKGPALARVILYP